MAERKSASFTQAPKTPSSVKQSDSKELRIVFNLIALLLLCSNVVFIRGKQIKTEHPKDGINRKRNGKKIKINAAI